MNGAFDFNTGTFNPRRISTRPLRPLRSSRLRRNTISPHNRRLSSLDDTFNNYFNFLRNQQDCLYHIVSQIGTMSMHAHNNMYDVYYRLLLAHVGENGENNENVSNNTESNTNTPQQTRYTNRALRSLRPESVNRPSDSNNPIRLVNPFANNILNTGLAGNNIGRLRPTTIRSFWTSPINFNLNNPNITLTPQEINEGTTSITLEEARNSNQTICPISHEEFTNETEIIKINHCGHMFKKQCLLRWFETHTTCPTCRYDLIQSQNTINVSTNTSTTSTQTNTTNVNNQTTNAGQTNQSGQSSQNNAFTNLFSDDFINTISNTLADSITQSINSFGADLSNNSLRADISMFMPLYNEAASNLNRNQGGNTSTTERGNEEKIEENTSNNEEKIEEEIDISNNHQQTENFDDDILNDAFDAVLNNASDDSQSDLPV